MAGERASRVLWVPVGGACNSRCVGCPGSRDDAIAPEEVFRRADARRPRALVLTGPGEPLLRRDLDELVHAARRASVPRVAVVTNGRTLSYPKVASAVASLELSHVIVTLLSPDAAVHDAMARVEGAHAQALAGLRNISSLSRGGRTSVIARAPVRSGEGGGLDELLALAIDGGASGLWVDGDDQRSLARTREMARQGRPVHAGGDIEAALAGPGGESRSRSGRSPVRLHGDEAAVSLVVRTGCRNACSFCTTRIIQETGRAPWLLDDLTAFHPELEEASSRGFGSLRFVAVEPLEHPDLPDLIGTARDLGFGTIEAWTSARALADPRWAARLASSGLTSVDVVILGSSATVHDAVARVRGSFDEARAGLAIAARHFETRYHSVITRQNQDDLEGIVRLGRSLGLRDPSWLVVPAPSPEDVSAYSRFAARMSELCAAAARLPADIRRVVLEKGLAYQVPPCILERTPGLDAGAPRAPASVRWVTEGSLEDPGAALKLRAPCPLVDGCAAGSRCPGYHEIYGRVFGTSEFVPL